MKLAKINGISYDHAAGAFDDSIEYVPVCNSCGEPVIEGLQIGSPNSGETYCDKPCAYNVRGKEVITEWLDWDEDDEPEEPDAWFTEHMGFYTEDDAAEIVDMTDRKIF